MIKLFLLGEAMGENEARVGAGFVGASGIELLRMLHEANVLVLTAEDFAFIRKYYDTSDPKMIDMIWRMHPEIHRSNVFQQHPPRNDLAYFCGPKAEGIEGYPALLKSKYVRKEFAHELDRLGDELVELNPNLVLALGNTALWALCGKTGISKLRGTTCISTHTASGFKVLATYHPAAVLRQWELRPTVVMDLIKASRDMEYPEIRRMKRRIWIEPSLEDIYGFRNQFCVPGSSIAVDIETAGTQITEIGFGPAKDLAIVIPFVDRRRKDRTYWPSRLAESKVWGIIREILGDRRVKKTFQNGLYDIAFLWRSYGIKVYGAEDDTMLLHHALQPESLKGLAFLGSVYCDEGAWKQDRNVGTIKRDD